MGGVSQGPVWCVGAVGGKSRSGDHDGEKDAGLDPEAAVEMVGNIRVGIFKGRMGGT